jgi:hypothetical protein
MVFTGNQADGALANGTRVIKTNSEPDDGHSNGESGTVIGSIKVPEEVREATRSMADFRFPNETHVYWVVWDAGPGLPVFTIGSKLQTSP